MPAIAINMQTHIHIHTAHTYIHVAPMGHCSMADVQWICAAVGIFPQLTITPNTQADRTPMYDNIAVERLEYTALMLPLACATGKLFTRGHLIVQMLIALHIALHA